jgi:hypothetical protein
LTSLIRTPDQRLRVFVSSTLQELADERVATKEAIQRLRLTPVMFETSARAHPPRDLYRAYLAQSDIFIGIYWQRYGWIAPNETVSGLEDEYLLAQQIPKLIYVKRADTRDDLLQVLIHRIRDEDKVSYRPFSDAAELKDLIENDLAVMLTERFTAARTGPMTDSTPQATFDAVPRSLAPVERGELIGRTLEVELVTELLGRSDTGLITLTVAEQQISRPYPRRIGWTSLVHILKHPALTPVHSDALHGCIDGVPSRDVSHSGMSETGVAGFELGH